MRKCSWTRSCCCWVFLAHIPARRRRQDTDCGRLAPETEPLAPLQAESHNFCSGWCSAHFIALSGRCAVREPRKHDHKPQTDSRQRGRWAPVTDFLLCCDSDYESENQVQDPSRCVKKSTSERGTLCILGGKCHIINPQSQQWLSKIQETPMRQNYICQRCKVERLAKASLRDEWGPEFMSNTTVYIYNKREFPIHLCMWCVHMYNTAVNLRLLSHRGRAGLWGVRWVWWPRAPRVFSLPPFVSLCISHTFTLAQMSAAGVKGSEKVV